MSKKIDAKTLLNGAKLILKTSGDKGIPDYEMVKDLIIQINNESAILVLPDCFDGVVIDPHGDVTKI